MTRPPWGARPLLAIVIAALVAPAMVAAVPGRAAATSTVVISQVYGGGGNAGATYTTDFIELYNRGTAAVDLTGWTVQYGSSGGTTWASTPLSGAVGPKSYYLVSEGTGAGGSVPLPAPNASGGIALSATSGKVALVAGTAILSGACPAGRVDLVGYGAGANCAEGSPAPGLTNTTAALRKAAGGTDTDSNAADFTAGAPKPRTSPTYDAAPSVTGTAPAAGAYDVAVDAVVTVAFSESVDLAAPWFTLTCSASGSHAAAVSGGPGTFTIDPDADFAPDEACTLTVLAAAVTDQDTVDPPNAMAANRVVAFTTEDTLAPAAGALGLSLTGGLLLSGTSMRAGLAWTGADPAPGSGIAGYELSRSLNGEDWTTIAAPATAASALTLASSGRVQFRARAVDRAGNPGSWAYGPGIAPSLVQQTAKAVVYRGVWRSASGSGFSGSSAKYATAAGASATYKVTARSVALVVAKGPGRGKLKVYVDGVLVKTVDTYRSKVQYRVQVWSRTWTAEGVHTIKIVVAGTPGRPRVDLDAFALLKGGQETPPGPETSTALSLLAALPTAAEDGTGYDRALFVHWIDADGNGCDTRAEVLIAESTTPVTVDADCAISGGTWHSVYDGADTTDASTFDVDHVVPLAEAWGSGAWGWTAARRQGYANDLGDARSLRAVSASSNRSKGDSDPAEWLPPQADFGCTYASEWIVVKTRWGLSVDSAERTVLAGMLAVCPPDAVTVVTQ